MTFHFLRRCQRAALAGGLALAPMAAAAASVGLQLAPGLTPQEVEAVHRQMAVTLEGAGRNAASATGGVAGASGGPCPAEAPRPCVTAGRDAKTAGKVGWQLEDDAWLDQIEQRLAPRSADTETEEVRWQEPDHRRQDPQAEARSAVHLPLNRQVEAPLLSWMQQLRLEEERPMPQRPILVLVRNGQVEAGWIWRDDIPLETAPLLSRDRWQGRLESGAALGEFFRHAQRLDSDALRWLPALWSGTDRDGWHILRHGVAPDLSAPARSPLSAPDPWDFR
ncbi:MAG: hypothetical protein ACQEXG_09910 [Pseudomonadota bacterium]